MKNHYLVPDYAMQFNCSMCSRCCRIWDIIFDDATMKDYKKIAQNDNAFSDNFKKLKENDNGTGHVVIPDEYSDLNIEQLVEAVLTRGNENLADEEFKDPNKACCFLNDKGLCSIQAKYGADSLSDTCKKYPRNIFLTERGSEIGLYYSCPTAAELLKNREPIEFYENPEDFEFLNLKGKCNQIGDAKERKKIGKQNYYEIESLLIDIMQTREMDINTRLILSGVVLEKGSTFDEEDLEKCMEIAVQEIIQQSKNKKYVVENMLLLIKEAMDERITLRPVPNYKMCELLRSGYIDLKLINDYEITDDMFNKFIDGYNKFYKPFEKDISHVFENYFVNYIFSKNFFTRSYKDAYSLMILFYSIIRFFTVCKCMAEEREATEDILVEIINTVERAMGHIAYYHDVLIDTLNGLKDIRTIIYL
ncbi:MAG: flagellin lysine-N-methylase [Deltaproteobacteria bacterium]